MTKAIRVHSPGGPDVMVLEDVVVGDPGPGMVRLRQTAIGLNYIDVYHRTGLYPMPLPGGIGVEAAGVVEAVGDGVADLAPGDRVAYALGAPPGAYAEARLMPADKLVKLPEGVSDETAAAALLQGMTVEYLFRRTHALEPGETFLFHAAAGGVGLIACQWARAIGARMIGTVSSDAKADLARAHGCAEVIVTSREDFTARVRALTDGRGVRVVYDSVGKDTFSGSLDCLAPRGLMVSFGNASGPVGPVDVGILGAKGSLFLTRPSLAAYVSNRAELEESSGALFGLMATGAITVPVRQRFALGAAPDAHRALESRATVGSTILVP